MSLISVIDAHLNNGADKLLEGANFSIEDGERVCLVGRNGTGKSTLLSIIAGKRELDSGKVIVQTGLKIATLCQDPPAFDSGTVYTLAASGVADVGDALSEFSTCTDVHRQMELSAYLDKHDGWQKDAVVKKILNKIGLDPSLPLKDLSGGNRRKAALAKALVSEPQLLLLDEPTNHLDIDSKEVLEEALLNYEGTLFTISHDRYFLNTVIDKILVLDENGITEYLGNYDYYIEKKKQAQEMSIVATTEEKTKTQLKDEKRKEREQREIEKKARVKRQNIEKEIEEVELKIEELDILMCQEEVYSNPEKAKEVSQNKSDLENRLSQLYEEWEEYM